MKKITMYEVWTRDPESDDPADYINGRILDEAGARDCLDAEVEKVVNLLSSTTNCKATDFVLMDSNQTLIEDSENGLVGGCEVTVLKAIDICLKDGVTEVVQMTVALLKKEYELGLF